MSNIQNIQLNSQGVANSSSNLIETYQTKKIVQKDNSDKFSKEDKTQTEKELSVKTVTNVLGVITWLGIVGYSVHKLKLLQKKSPEMILDKAKNKSKQALSDAENAAFKDTNIDELLANSKFKHLIKAAKNMGDGFQGLKMKWGSELFNNYTYAFGTLVVMPLVVLFSPFGKKDSSKEDKAFAVLRQPLSVAATLGLQYTFDKLISKFVPEVIEQNKLEDKNLFDKNGEFILNKENYNKIKYNSNLAKKSFEKLAEEHLSADEIKELFTNKSFEEDSASTYENKLKNLLNDKYNLKLENLYDILKNDIHKPEGSFSAFKDESKNAKAAKSIEELMAKFETFIRVLNTKEMKIQKTKTNVNIFFAAAISCTFLNVIYGKSMKAYKTYKDKKNKQQEEQAKEVK